MVGVEVPGARAVFGSGDHAHSRHRICVLQNVGRLSPFSTGVLERQPNGVFTRYGFTPTNLVLYVLILECNSHSTITGICSRG